MISIAMEVLITSSLNELMTRSIRSKKRIEYKRGEYFGTTAAIRTVCREAFNESTAFGLIIFMSLLL